MYRTGIACCVALLAGVAGVGADDQTPAARIVELKGTATLVERAADESAASDEFARPAAAYLTIYAGQQLIVADKSRVTLVFRTGGHFERIVAAGTFQVTPRGCQPKQGVEQLLFSQKDRAAIDKINADFPRVVQGGVVVAMAPAPGYEPSSGICPFHNSTLLETRPVFSWPPSEKSKQYTVRLHEIDEEGRRVPGSRAWSDTTEEAELTYTGPALTWGAQYRWEVTAPVDGRRKLRSRTESVCWGEFRVASAEVRDKADSLAQITAQSEPALITLSAMWYREFGLLREAIALNEQLAELTADPAVYGELETLYYEVNDTNRADAAAEKMMQLEQLGQTSEEEGGGSVSGVQIEL